MSLILRLPRDMHVYRSPSNVPRWKTHTFSWVLKRAPGSRNGLNIQKWSEWGVCWAFSARHVFRAIAAHAFSTSQMPKVLPIWRAFWFSLGNLLRATTACTFSSSQLPEVFHLRRLVHLHVDMCYAFFFPKVLHLKRFMHFHLESASLHDGVHFFCLSFA